MFWVSFVHIRSANDEHGMIVFIHLQDYYPGGILYTHILVLKDTSGKFETFELVASHYMPSIWFYNFESFDLIVLKPDIMILTELKNTKGNLVMKLVESRGFLDIKVLGLAEKGLDPKKYDYNKGRTFNYDDKNGLLKEVVSDGQELNTGAKLYVTDLNS